MSDNILSNNSFEYSSASFENKYWLSTMMRGLIKLKSNAWSQVSRVNISSEHEKKIICL